VEGVQFSSGTFSSITLKNNLTTGAVITATSPGSSIVTASGNIDNTDAKLVAPTTFDFHLQSGSPAINQGLTLSQVKTDIEATPRPQGGAFDIGAYESH
jgi:hypothetical protein